MFFFPKDSHLTTRQDKKEKFSVFPLFKTGWLQHKTQNKLLKEVHRHKISTRSKINNVVSQYKGKDARINTLMEDSTHGTYN